MRALSAWSSDFIITYVFHNLSTCIVVIALYEMSGKMARGNPKMMSALGSTTIVFATLSSAAKALVKYRLT